MNSSTDKSNGLMGDLESIKALLEEDDLTEVPESLSEALNPLPDISSHAVEMEVEDESVDKDVPIEDTLASDEHVPLITDALISFDPVTGISEPTAPKAKGSLDELLGSDFHDATSEVMQRARALIDQNANQWSPQQTDELADALRVRIDDAVGQWIKTSLDAHALELQQRLLNAVRDELSRHLESFEHTSE